MELTKLAELAFKRDLSEHSALEDAFGVVRLLEKEDFDLAHKYNRRVNSLAAKYAKEQVSADMYDLYNRSMIFEAPHDFDFFMRTIERNRPVKEQFWLPRRSKLLPIAKALQDMEYGNLDELFLSCPPRIGKSTLMMMFFLWTMGRNSERSNLYCSYTDSVVGVLAELLPLHGLYTAHRVRFC